MTKEHPLVPRWPAVALAALALAGVVLMTLPAEDVRAAPVPVEDTSQSQVTAPVRPASFGRRFGGVNPGRNGPIVLGLTIADLGDPSTVSVPTAAQPPAARIPAVPRITTTAEPGTAAVAAIAFALAQRGLPYVWGGDGPQSGEAGFDCSGLTTAAYDWAGVSLPRTAHTQYYAGPHVPADAPLEPGDLVFYGVPERVHHVGLYLGNGRMINAPTFGRPVRTAFVRYPGDDYLGATRPAAGRDAPGLLDEADLPFDVPPEPAPDAPPGPAEFPAPPAPDDPPAIPPVPSPQAPAPPTESAVAAAPAPDAPTAAAAPDRSASQVPSTSPAADGSASPVPSTSPAPGKGPVGSTATAGSATAGAAASSGPPGGDASTTAGQTAGRPAAGSEGASATPPPATDGALASPTTGNPARSAPAQATTTPPTSTPNADEPGESGARATTPPPSSGPASSTPTSSAPAQATTAPPPRTPRADASTTRPRETGAGATSPPPTSTPAQATPAPRDANADAATSSPPSSDVALPPNTVGLPDGETLRLVAARAGADGPVAAPTGAGTASVMRSGGTTVITLPPTAGTVGLSRGGTIQLTDASGDPSEFEVQGKRTVDADTAAEFVASGDNRLVLLQALDDGEVLVVLAN